MDTSYLQSDWQFQNKHLEVAIRSSVSIKSQTIQQALNETQYKPNGYISGRKITPVY